MVLWYAVETLVSTGGTPDHGAGWTINQLLGPGSAWLCEMSKGATRYCIANGHTESESY